MRIARAEVAFVTRTLAAIVLLAAGASAQATAPGAKAMFYHPGGVPQTVPLKTIAADPPRLAPIDFAPSAALRSAHLGIHYWFETDDGRAYGERGAATAGGHYTLRIRGNAGAFVSVWDMDRDIELMSRTAITGGTRLDGGEELAIPDVFELAADAPERRFIIVWGRSQTEQAGRPAGAVRRLADLSSRLGRDGAPQIIRESDDVTPGQIGTYVINREGMPLATELRFRAR
jgi:hypothetical protein